MVSVSTYIGGQNRGGIAAWKNELERQTYFPEFAYEAYI